MQCEMCGSEKAELYKTKVEGVVLNLCKDCSSFGEVVAPVSKNEAKAKRAEKPAAEELEPEKEVIYLIDSDYASKIRSARERKGLKQEELAKRLALKESLLHSFESGRHEPSISIAKKLESFLGISLVRQEEVEIKQGKKQGQREELTLGDVIKVRKK